MTKDIRLTIAEASLQAVVAELEEAYTELERMKRIQRRMAKKIVTLKKAKCFWPIQT